MRCGQLAAITLLAVFGACTDYDLPRLVIDDVEFFAPLPGQNAGVAYLKIENNSDVALQVKEIRSPQFGKIEIHETTVTDGIAKMRRLSSANIDARSILEFAPGGLHLMLLEAGHGVQIATPVSLEIEVGDSIFLVTAPLQDRHTKK